MKMLSVFALAGSLALGASSGTALAGPTEDAKAHFNAIGAGDVNRIVSAYTDDSRFYWIGGPLDGDYTGTEAIRGVWAKFTKVQGDMKVSVEKLEEAGNPKGTTVTANVVFAGKATIKVRYVLTYRGDKLVAETWQIAPKLAIGGGY